jgi:hypothetical protein
MSGKSHASNFVGQWVPTFLILGLSNKLVKQLGSDRVSLEPPLRSAREAGSQEARPLASTWLDC